MDIDQQNIIGELERLAAAFPWDAVDLWIKRQPEGEISFTAYVSTNSKFGFDSVFGSGNSPSEAVDQAVEQSHKRDPEIAKKAKIRELKEQIEKLSAVVVGLPPYRHGTRLSNGQPIIRVRETVDVSATPSIEQPAAV